MGIIVALVGWFYWWTARPEPRGPLLSRESSSYYNLLVRGFLKGRLALDAEVDPFLATLENPWLPEQRQGHGLADVSYYRGRYYLYFGVTPALVLFLPFRSITGWFIDDSPACVIFVYGGFLASVGLLLAVRRKYFPQAGLFARGGCVLALGLANMAPALLRRTSVWEIPIACAYLCFMAALCALFAAMCGRRRGLWLAVASACLALAIGSRPTYLAAGLLLLPPMLLWTRQAGGWRVCVRDAEWRKTLLAALAPALAVGAGLALYNYLRFGSITEFGQSYQISTGDLRNTGLFGWQTFFYNLRLYLFSPAGLSPYFPFVTVISPPPAPVGHLGMENPYGVLPNIPFALLGFGLVGMARRHPRPAETEPLRMLLAGIGLAVVGTMATVAAFGGATNRYMVDFVPGMVVLACMGMLAVLDHPVMKKRVARGVAAAGCAVLLLHSITFNVLVSLQHNNLLRASYPQLYRRIAFQANRLSDLLDRWQGATYGPVEMRVVFPQDSAGQMEPLVVTGRSFLSDYLLVQYINRDTVRFVFEHTSRGAVTGPPADITPGRIHSIRIDMGSLYPPAEHPYFTRMNHAQTVLRQRTLRVEMDHRVVLQGYTECYDAVSRTPSIGKSENRPAFRRPFSGKILSWRRVPDAAPEAEAVQYGPVRLELTFPAFTGRRSEPLLCTGETGRGDLIYVTYEARRRISFGHDHWGVGGTATAPVGIDPRAVHLLEIDFAALYPDGPAAEWRAPVNRDRLIIRLDGRTICDEPAQHHPSRPDEVTVGANPIGASTATPQFSGSINWVERLEEPLARP